MTIRLGAKRFAALLTVSASLAGCLLVAGCTRQQRAIDAAKKDVAATLKPEEVIYVDGRGDTTVTMVSPPPPGATAFLVTQTTFPAGSRSVTGMPDWSDGQHPPTRHVARYRAPGLLVEPAQPAELESATDPAARAYSGAVTQIPDDAAPARTEPTNTSGHREHEPRHP